MIASRAFEKFGEVYDLPAALTINFLVWRSVVCS